LAKKSKICPKQQIYQDIGVTIKTLTNLDDVSNRVVPKPDFVGRGDIKSKASVKDHKEIMTKFVVRHHKKGIIFLLFISKFHTYIAVFLDLVKYTF